MSSTRDTIFALPIVGILRGFQCEQLPRILEAVLRGGLKALEITMNSPEAARQITEANQIGEERIVIGAGTVTSMALLREALSAGARFIVTPTLHPSVIEACVAEGIPIFPGALSPAEIYRAWEMQATMVKVFPNLGGAAYLKSLRGPFPEIKLMPTGGVELATLPSLLEAGAAGFGIGSPLFHPQRIQSGDWPWLENQTRSFIELYQRHRPLSDSRNGESPNGSGRGS